MKQVKKIFPATNWFIDSYHRLTKEKRMVTNTELARIMGLKNKSAINNILAKGQNIQPAAWEKYRIHFNLGESKDDSQISEPVGVEKSEPSARDILMVLAEAIDKHEHSSIKHAEAYGKLADALKAQHDSFIEMRKEMARETTLADVASSSIEILAGVRSLSKRQKQAIADLRKDVAELKSQKVLRSPGSNKNQDRNGGA